MRNFLMLILLTILSCSSSASDGRSAAADDSSVKTIIYLSRHAEKGGGENPQLTAAGRQRAQRLAKQLGGEKIAAVYATGYRRTEATARPLAKKVGKLVRKYSATESARVLADTWIDEHRGKTIVVIGHSNTVPGLVNALIGEKRFGDIDEDDYGQLFKVVVDSDDHGRVEILTSD